MLKRIRRLIHGGGFHPSLWWNGLFSYSRFMGHVWPRLIDGDASGFPFRRKLFTSTWTPRHLTVPVGRRILALSPHPDDETIGAGGLLWAHRDVAELHVVVVTNGARGGSLANYASASGPKDRLVDARRQEMARAARMLGVRGVEYLDFPDGNVPVDPTACETLRDIVTRFRPDVVLLPWLLDGHPDHRRTNLLFARACGDLECTVLAYEVWTLLEPNALFDFSDHLASKLALIDCFESQLRTVDYRSYAESLARVRSFAAGSDKTSLGAMEAFMALPAREYCALVNELSGSTDGGGSAREAVHTAGQPASG